MTLLLLLAGSGSAGPVPIPDGVSVAGGAVTLVAEWCPTRGPYESVPNGEWIPLRGFRGDITTNTGRQDDISQFSAGSMSADIVDHPRVNDPDLNRPWFDPDNPASPYAGQLHPFRQVRLRAWIDYARLGLDTAPEVVPVWRGYIKGFPEDESIDDRTRIFPLSATDLQGVLAQLELFRNTFMFGVPGRDLLDYSRLAAGDGDVLPVQTTGERVLLLADAAGVPAELLDIDPGLSTMTGTQPTGKTWSAITDAEKAEDGFAFIDGAGHLVFADRSRPWLDDRMRTPQATFADTDEAVAFTSNRTDHSDDYLFNLVTRTPEGGGVRVARDQASIDDTYEHPSDESVAISDPLVVQGLADGFLDRHHEVKVRLPQLELRPMRAPGTWLPIVLGLRVLDRVRVIRRGIERDLMVQGISHRFSSGDWVTTVNLAPVRRDDVFIFGDPVRDVLDETPLAY